MLVKELASAVIISVKEMFITNALPPNFEPNTVYSVLTKTAKRKIMDDTRLTAIIIITIIITIICALDAWIIYTAFGKNKGG